MVMGGSNMQNACKCCATHPKQQSTNVDSLGRIDWSSSSNLPTKIMRMMTMTKQHCQSNVNNDGDDGDGGDSNGNFNDDSNSDDADAAANSDDVDDNDSGVLRTAIGQRQLDNNDGTTMM
jgi:hypothetical protein